MKLCAYVGDRSAIRQKQGSERVLEIIKPPQVQPGLFQTIECRFARFDDIEVVFKDD